MHIGLRPVAARGVDALCEVVGRQRVVRAARFALHRSRLDLPNDPRSNGEYALQRWVLAALPLADRVTVVDVGAHVGRWSRRLLKLAGRTGHQVSLHAFEPASDTHRMLAATLPEPARAIRAAVSDRSGELTLHLAGQWAGRNSLLDPGGESPAQVVERVPATTLDEYVSVAGIEHIDLLKVDAEGNDLAVLGGAQGLLERQAVSVAQFEYNHRWVHARYYLKDAFDLLGPLGYQVGKLTPRGVEWYRAWDPDLETFTEGNYVAAGPGATPRLPAVRWWKEGMAPCTSV